MRLTRVWGRRGLVVGALAVITLGIFWSFTGTSQTSASFDVDNQGYWQKRIQELGGAAAYGELAKIIGSLSRNEQHRGAHSFGAALYEALGESGLSVCDSHFSFGCFHEFLGRAIAEKGFAAVPRLNEGCREVMSDNVLACQHGIGHGVMAAIGYERLDLKKALDICKDLPYSDPIGGCYGGVFMEYNLRTMLGDDASAREDEGGPHEPCASLAPDFRYACYFWQPQWWEQALFHGNVLEEVYAQMGTFCTEVKEYKDRRACFEGIGNITAQASDFRGKESARLCDTISSSLQHRTLCRSVAANHLGVDVNAKEARAACDGLPQKFREYCLQHAANTANVANTIPLPGTSSI